MATNPSSIRLVVSGFHPLAKFTRKRIGSALVLSAAPVLPGDFNEAEL
jgi:hypothetical protein